jgi:pimeloyl-ACP methyl ester carboxylesterase
VLDTLGVSTVTVIGHSSGCTVATALAEQRPDAAAGLALIDFGPSLAAKTPEQLLFRLLLTPFPGRLLWRLRNSVPLSSSSGSWPRTPIMPWSYQTVNQADNLRKTT